MAAKNVKVLQIYLLIAYNNMRQYGLFVIANIKSLLSLESTMYYLICQIV